MFTSFLTRLAAAAAVSCGTLAVAQESTPFPDRYFFQGAPRDLEGKPVPEIAVTDWTTKAPTKKDLKGKVVLIDFWATWCPPCRAALPKNAELWKKHKDDGLVIIGIHDSRRGTGTMRQVMEQYGVTYPNAIDDGGKSVKAFGVRFWPTYVAIDHKGIVRAVGLNPNFVPEVVDALLEERAADAPDEEPEETPDADPASTSGGEISSDWLEGHKGRRNQLDSLQGEEAPALEVSDWINADDTTLADLRGKVVMLDFWATWCAPCLQSVPETNQLAEKYADRGLVVVGVCAPRGMEKMGETVLDRHIAYPVCADKHGKTAAAYAVDGFPDYYFIDRAGRVRVADARHDRLEVIIEALLSEPAPADESN